MNNAYLVDCVNVMVTAMAVVVVGVALFVCFSLILWAANMLRNFVATDPLRQLNEDEAVYLPPIAQSASQQNGFAPQPGIGMPGQRFPQPRE